MGRGSGFAAVAYRARPEAGVSLGTSTVTASFVQPGTVRRASRANNTCLSRPHNHAVTVLDGLYGQGWKRCFVQTFIQSQQPITPSLSVSPYEKISKNAPRA
jgi:hypothetical protein